MSIVHKYKYVAQFKDDNCCSISSFYRMKNKRKLALRWFIINLYICLMRELIACVTRSMLEI